MKKQNILIWTIVGAVVGIFAGSALHFVFEWTGRWSPAALVAAVNESTWEHLKLAFWPAFIFAIIQYFFTGKNNKNFFFAKAINFVSAPLIIVALFYGWLAFFKDSFIWDISIFVVAVIVAYIFDYIIQKSKIDFSKYNILWILIIIAILLKFSLFTYFPPNLFLFQDPISGGYGIVK